MFSILLIAVKTAISVHPDVPVMMRIVQLDVVRTGLVDDEQFPQVRLTYIISTDSAGRFTAQVLAVERLEGEHSLFLGSGYRLHFEFLPGAWPLIIVGTDLSVLFSLEPSLIVHIVEGEPF